MQQKKKGRKRCHGIKKSNHQQLESPWLLLLCLFMFASPFIFLLYISFSLCLTGLCLQGIQFQIVIFV